MILHQPTEKMALNNVFLWIKGILTYCLCLQNVSRLICRTVFLWMVSLELFSVCALCRGLYKECCSQLRHIEAFLIWQVGKRAIYFTIQSEKIENIIGWITELEYPYQVLQLNYILYVLGNTWLLCFCRCPITYMT